MLRFNSTASAAINNNTFWSETNFTGSEILLSFTSSFSGHTQIVLADVISNKFNGFGGWILIETNTDLIPTSSGQYSLNIYGGNSGQATWGSYLKQWKEADVTFGNATGITQGTLLSNERGFVTGSDFKEWILYNFQNNAIYTVYNG
jgi:hypothetical protein